MKCQLLAVLTAELLIFYFQSLLRKAYYFWQISSCFPNELFSIFHHFINEQKRVLICYLLERNLRSCLEQTVSADMFLWTDLDWLKWVFPSLLPHFCSGRAALYRKRSCFCTAVPCSLTYSIKSLSVHLWTVTGQDLVPNLIQTYLAWEKQPEEEGKDTYLFRLGLLIHPTP